MKKTDWVKIVSAVGVVIFCGALIREYMTQQTITLALAKYVSGIALMLLPLWVRKKTTLFTDGIIVMIQLFILITVYAGERFGLYWRFEHYDSMLHVLSGGILTLVGYRIAISVHDGPLWFNLIFAFAFAMTCGIGWEVYEFTADGLMNLNLQRYMGLSERAVIFDTMKDILCNISGSVLGLIYIKIKGSKS